MKRSVSAQLELVLHDTADLVFSIAVADGLETTETFTIRSAGAELEPHVIAGRHGTRLHRLTGPAGPMTVDYSAEGIGQARQAPVEGLDLIDSRRPSRYCESDTLFSTAHSEFPGLSGKALLDAVSSWVGEHLSYVPGPSHPQEGGVAAVLGPGPAPARGWWGRDDACPPRRMARLRASRPRVAARARRAGAASIGL